LYYEINGRDLRMNIYIIIAIIILIWNSIMAVSTHFAKSSMEKIRNNLKRKPQAIKAYKMLIISAIGAMILLLVMGLLSLLKSPGDYFSTSMTILGLSFGPAAYLFYQMLPKK
jgi:hypothetical protein